jgi:hypothetical protein
MKWLQLAAGRLLGKSIVVDGLPGPQTTQALKELQAKFGLPTDGIARPKTLTAIKEALRDQNRPQALRALVIHPSKEEQIRQTRGHSESGVDLAEFYSQSGATVSVIDNPDPERIHRDVHTFLPHVIHLVASVHDSSRTGEVSLAFGDEQLQKDTQREKRVSHLFTASWMSLMLKSFPDNRQQPLVVLDVPRPSGITETVRQLLLRNYFATLLFDLGSTGGVIATGLARLWEQGHLSTTLISGLTSGNSLAEVSRDIRRFTPDVGASDDDLEEVVASAGTVLLTSFPSLSVIATGEAEKSWA